MDVKLLRRIIVRVFALCLTIGLACAIGARAGQTVSQGKLESKKTDKTGQIPVKKKDLAVGDTIPDHKLVDLRGNVVKLSSLLHRRTVISFFLPGCEICEQEIKFLLSAVRDTTDYRYFILLSASSADRLAKSLPPNRQLLVLRDSGGVYGDLLGIKTVPLNMIVDRSGRVEKITEDAMKLKDYEQIIEFNRTAESKVK